MRTLAPIAIFAFNRPASFKALVESLLSNDESKDSDLFIFIDGIRIGHSEDKSLVKETIEVARQIRGFKNVKITLSPKNKGLAESIIQGVGDVISRYGKCIVLEDDLYLGRNFLAFMNEGLEKYETIGQVFSVCGYNNTIKIPEDYKYDMFFAPRSSSWGWGTWKDRWEKVDWKLANWEKVQADKRAFNKWGGSDCYRMLSHWRTGKNSSWAIRFVYSQFRENGVSAFPLISKIKNNGFDGTGTHCKRYNRYKCTFDTSSDKTFRWQESIQLNKTLLKRSLSYYSIPIRIWSRLMNMIMR